MAARKQTIENIVLEGVVIVTTAYNRRKPTQPTRPTRPTKPSNRNSRFVAPPEGWGPKAYRRPSALPYSNGKRVRYSLFWTITAALFIIGGLSAIAASPGVCLLGLALSAAAGTYAYRIWTWKAKHLWFFIVL